MLTTAHLNHTPEDCAPDNLRAMCQEAAMAPLRELGGAIANIPANKVRAIAARDLTNAARVVRPSVNRAQLAELDAWNRDFGSGVMS